jgi:hypothetical protein
MQPADADRFRNLLRGIGRTFGQEPDALVLDAYWLALSTWSIADFEAACAQLLRTSKFMPRPADFEELRKAGRLTAGEAWGRVVAHARAGRYRREQLAPEIERGVQAIGGWPVIAMSEESKLSFIERRFAEHFGAMREADDIRAAVPQLAGPPAGKLLEQQS